MAQSIKLKDDTYIDTSGIWDATEEKTQAAINSELKESLSTSESIAYPDYTGTKLHSFTNKETWIAPRNCMIAGYIAYATSQGGHDTAVSTGSTILATAYSSAGNMYVGVSLPVKSGTAIKTTAYGDYSHLFAV